MVAAVDDLCAIALRQVAIKFENNHIFVASNASNKSCEWVAVPAIGVTDLGRVTTNEDSRARVDTLSCGTNLVLFEEFGFVEQEDCIREAIAIELTGRGDIDVFSLIRILSLE